MPDFDAANLSITQERPSLCRRLVTYEVFPTPVWLYPAFLGITTGFLCAGLDSWTLGREWSVGVAVLMATLWTVVNVVLRRPAASAVVTSQLVLSVTLISVSVLMVFARTGQNVSSSTGLTYWRTMNRGYRFNPEWAARPAWLALAGAAWFASLLVYVLLRSGRKGRAAPPCARTCEPQ